MVQMGAASKPSAVKLMALLRLVRQVSRCPPSPATGLTDSGGGLGDLMQGERSAKKFSLSL
jgi:hypothetical protein